MAMSERASATTSGETFLKMATQGQEILQLIEKTKAIAKVKQMNINELKSALNAEGWTFSTHDGEWFFTA